MKIKLDAGQHGYLYSSLLQDRAELAQYFKGKQSGRKIIISLGENIAEQIRDWAGEKLQRIGFDGDYNLTKEGEVLEILADKIYNAQPGL